MATRLTKCGPWQAIERAGRVNRRAVQIEEKSRTVCWKETFGMRKAEPGREVICEEGRAECKEFARGALQGMMAPVCHDELDLVTWGALMRGSVRPVTIFRGKAQ